MEHQQIRSYVAKVDVQYMETGQMLNKIGVIGSNSESTFYNVILQ